MNAASNTAVLAAHEYRIAFTIDGCRGANVMLLAAVSVVATPARSMPRTVTPGEVGRGESNDLTGVLELSASLPPWDNRHQSQRERES